MRDAERLTMVMRCKLVEKVVPGCPYMMNNEYLDWVINKYKINYMVLGDDYCIVNRRMLVISLPFYFLSPSLCQAAPLYFSCFYLLTPIPSCRPPPYPLYFLNPSLSYIFLHPFLSCNV